MKTSTIAFSAAALAASLTLTACGNSGAGSAGANDAAVESNVANSASAKGDAPLPPSILKSRTYRCRDNSIVYVDFFTDDTAAVRTEQTGLPTRLASEGGNPPFAAEGYSVSANADQAEIKLPGKGAQTCRSNG